MKQFKRAIIGAIPLSIGIGMTILAPNIALLILLGFAFILAAWILGLAIEDELYDRKCKE